jgi:hypothetical protein
MSLSAKKKKSAAFPTMENKIFTNILGCCEPQAKPRLAPKRAAHLMVMS